MRIHLPAETWAEILAWLNRREFAQKMELLWDREFTPIAEKWLHEWSRGHKIGLLKFDMDKHANQAELYKYHARRNYWKKQFVPFAEVEVPMNINSFEQIRIRYLDNTILDFLRKMKPLLRRNVHLSIESYCDTMKVALDHLLPLFNNGGDSEFESVKLVNVYDLALLDDQRYASALMNTKLLNFCVLPFDFFFELLANWLFTKRADGQPRMLVLPYYHSVCHDFITEIKERFLTATEGFPFIIRFKQHFDSSVMESTIENDKIGQQLIIGKCSRNDMCRYTRLISYPLNMNRELLAEWERKVLDADSLYFERDFQLMFPLLGPLNPIEDPQQLSGSSAKVSVQQEMPGTSKSLKRNAQNDEEEEEEGKADCGEDKMKKKRFQTVHGGEIEE